MKIILLAITAVLLNFGCYQDKGPSILVVDMISGSEYSLCVSEGDWYIEGGIWKDARNLVIPANAHSVSVLEEYLGARQVAQSKEVDKLFN